MERRFLIKEDRNEKDMSCIKDISAGTVVRFSEIARGRKKLKVGKMIFLFLLD